LPLARSSRGPPQIELHQTSYRQAIVGHEKGRWGLASGPPGSKSLGIKSRAAPVWVTLRSARQCWELKDVFHQGTTRLLPGSHNALAQIRRRKIIGNPHGHYAPPVRTMKSHRAEHAYDATSTAGQPWTTARKLDRVPLKRAEIPIQTGEGQEERNEQTGSTEQSHRFKVIDVR
jgi:hypothetical protein